MIKRNLYKCIVCVLSLLSAVTACKDDFPYNDVTIGEGETSISFIADFNPLVASNNNASRTAGDVLGAINDMTLFLYNKDKELYKIIPSSKFNDYSVQTGGNTSMPEDMPADADQAESKTDRATFTLDGIPFGQYYIYTAVNMGLDDSSENYVKFATPDDLRDFEVQWNEENIAANNQMFGYFTYNGHDDRKSTGFDAPLVTLNQVGMELHSWLKRAASKVSLVYDGSKLKNGVWIYIKNVTIHDIPLNCKIGNDNTLTEEQWNKKEYFVNGETLTYNNNGVIPAGDVQSSSFRDWLIVSKGSGKKGAVTQSEDGGLIEHSETDAALYFYENMQGNYEDDPNKANYDKVDYWPNVGFVSNDPGDHDYKDNVVYGTYIEVEAYYVSENSENMSSGPIKYRYMLGMDDHYDYNAARNHHYKLTLGFNGWANQPTWHIVYEEKENTFYNDPTYYISYMYNQRAVFPIRFTSQPKEFEVEIVENNWAPYDKNYSDSVPPAEVSDATSTLSENLQFRWNKDAYEGKVGPYKDATQYGGYTRGEYNYSMQSPYDTEGKLWTSYPDVANAPKKVTPIWAGFLALMVPEGKLAANILTQADGYTYSAKDDLLAFRNYYYGRFAGKGSTPANKIPQNIRRFKNLDFKDWKEGEIKTKIVGTDDKEISSEQGNNNACKIIKNADGSVTLNLPMWTRPKILLGISGFSGNNPYDTYQRKAVVRLKATFADGTVVERFAPVMQVRRVVNPKGVWHRYDDTKDFQVTLTRREGASSSKFSSFKSEGAWRAYVKTSNAGGFISLVGGVAHGIGPNGEAAIVGNTDTPIDFTIKFNSKGMLGEARCAIVEVEYHGYTCVHSIFVRQGYSQPLAIKDGGAKWSSFSIYKTGTTLDTKTGAVSGDIPFKTEFTDNKYQAVVLTKSPLALGSLFKRGNYNGILVENNAQSGLGALDAPGKDKTFKMTNGSNLTWKQINGLPYSSEYRAKETVTIDNGNVNKTSTTFAWTRFNAVVANEVRKYRVPTIADYNDLLTGDYGLGVLYSDGATETATEVDDAYGFEDFDNDGSDNVVDKSTRGMRGLIVFNPDNANQIFFPLGARGIGRRTITGFTKESYDAFGTLRYGGVSHVLTGETNALRPIPYNLPASPGAIYWAESARSVDGSASGKYLGWDMNYFDFNFNAYENEISFTPGGDNPGGDALPIKLVIDE